MEVKFMDNTMLEKIKLKKILLQNTNILKTKKITKIRYVL